jgi:hypothetical protein
MSKHLYCLGKHLKQINHKHYAITTYSSQHLPRWFNFHRRGATFIGRIEVLLFMFGFNGPPLICGS